MNNLYRIKPLVWTDDVTYSDGRTAVESGYYYIELISENQWFWCYKRGYESDYGKASSLEGAKAACESHRRKLLEAEIEVVFDGREQPSTTALRELLTRYRKAKDALALPRIDKMPDKEFLKTIDNEEIEHFSKVESLGVIPSARKPSTELPTEPGLYWWRTADAKEYDPVKPWLPVRVEVGSGGVAVIPLWGDRMMIKAWDRFHGPGQWIRIPEPEVENG